MTAPLESAQGETKVCGQTGNPGPLTYESVALPTALRDPASHVMTIIAYIQSAYNFTINYGAQKFLQQSH